MINLILVGLILIILWFGIVKPHSLLGSEKNLLGYKAETIESSQNKSTTIIGAGLLVAMLSLVLRTPILQFLQTDHQQTVLIGGFTFLVLTVISARIIVWFCFEVAKYTGKDIGNRLDWFAWALLALSTVLLVLGGGRFWVY